MNIAADECCDTRGESETCNADCSCATCGDSIVNSAANEACDDATPPNCEEEGFAGGVLSCSDCELDTSGCINPAAAPELQLELRVVKQLELRWDPVEFANAYEVEEQAGPNASWVVLDQDDQETSFSHTVPLHLWGGARYRVTATNDLGAGTSDEVELEVSQLTEGVGYFKASNTDAEDGFGRSVALSQDGRTLAVGAPGESSSDTGVGGTRGGSDNDLEGAGAAYVFGWDDESESWSQQGHFKAAHPDAGDGFGWSISLSDDGETLVVGAPWEDSTYNLGTDENSATDSGIVYVYRRLSGDWEALEGFKRNTVDGSHVGESFGWSVDLSGDGDRMIIGAPNRGSTGNAHVFEEGGGGPWSEILNVPSWGIINLDTPGAPQCGSSVALSGDGNTLAVGCPGSGMGVLANSGSVLVIDTVSGAVWSLDAEFRDGEDRYGASLSLNDDGTMLAIGAPGEDSSAFGVANEESFDDEATDAGAVYLYERSGAQWERSYIKSSNTSPGDAFGTSVSLSGNGSLLAVGARYESSDAVGIDGPDNDDAPGSGAVYIYERDEAGVWSPRSYVKAPLVDPDAEFGGSAVLSGDGLTLAVGAEFEDGSDHGVSGTPDDDAPGAGAVYVY